MRASLCVPLVSVAALSVCPAVAQETPVPTVSEDAGGAAQENKTDAAAKVEDDGERVDGWSPGIAIGASFNLVDTRSVVGQMDGTTVNLGAVIDASLEFNSGMHEWRNGLLAAAGASRTPAIDEFIKTNDGLAFESIYLLHVLEIFGPFARFGLNAQMFPGTDIRAGAVNYVVANLDGSTDAFTGRRLRLTDPFEPITLKESLGVFVQPIRDLHIELEGRAGLGAQETFAAGALAVSDDDATADIVEVKELDDNYAIGAEGVVNAWGFFDHDKRTSYTIGIGVLVPFVTSDLPEGDDRGLGDLVAVEGILGLNAKLFDWASLGYRLNVVRQPLLLDEWQISNTLLLTIGAAFGSKAPEPPAPPCPPPEPPKDEEPPAEDEAPAADQPEPGAEEAPVPVPEEAPVPAPQPAVEPAEEPKEEGAP
jgi:hypothetical protein